MSEQDSTELSDPQLLSKFVSGRDAAAFESLVRRHGPMVMGVCRRVLRDPHAAEDAFQATFLVLFNKAREISRPELLANWLYGVATHKALKARAAIGRRRMQERPMSAAAAAMEPESSRDVDLWLDLEPILDEELSNLPDEYRAPIVLCDLAGKTIKDAAGLLDCPQGTLAGRLAKAREMLAQQVTRRGLILSLGTLTVLLTQHASSVAIPESTVNSLLSIAGSSMSAARPLSPLRNLIGSLQPASWSPLAMTRWKLFGMISLAFGVGSLSLASFNKILRDRRQTEMAANAQAEAEKVRQRLHINPPMPDGFIVTPGEYHLFNNAIKFVVPENNPDIRWKVGLFPAPPYSSVDFFLDRGGAAESHPDQFYYLESPERIWHFDGREKVWLHTITYASAKDGRFAGSRYTVTGTGESTVSVGPAHEKEFIDLKPPEPVRKRMAPWFEASPALQDGCIVAVGKYKLFKGATTVWVTEEKGLISFSVSLETYRSWSGRSDIKSGSSWKLFVDSPTRAWTFDGLTTVSRHEHAFIHEAAHWNEGKPRQMKSNRVSTNEAKLPEQMRDFVEWRPPNTVRRWLKLIPGAEQAAAVHGLEVAQLATKDAPADEFITKPGEYKLFDGATIVKVTEVRGHIQVTIPMPPREEWTPSENLNSKSSWMLFVETPERIWTFDGVDAICLHTREHFLKGSPGPDGAPRRTESISNTTSVLTLPLSMYRFLDLNPPAPVRRWLKLIKRADRRDLYYPRSPDQFVRKPPNADGAITGTGEYTLFENALTVRVWEQDGKIGWSMRRTQSGEDPGTFGTPSMSRVRKDSPWFVFPESANRIWLFDGVGTIVLWRETVNEPPKPRGRTSEVIHVDLPTWSEKEYGMVPEAVLKRLPAGLRPRPR